MTKVYSSSVISCILSFKEFWKRSYDWKLSNFNGKMEGSQRWTARELISDELIYEGRIKNEGRFTKVACFPYQLLVTQEPLRIVGDVMAKESWQGVVSHPVCGCTQPCGILHGDPGGQWKVPLILRNCDRGTAWLREYYLGFLAHVYLEGLNILVLWF